MSKEKVVFVLGSIMMVIASLTTVYAANYLYNSKEISFDNTGTGIQSDNVQGAVDELFDYLTDYTDLKNKLDTYIPNGTKSKFDDNILRMGIDNQDVNKGSIIAFYDSSQKQRGALQYSPTSDGMVLDGRNTTGTVGTGSVDIKGSTIKFNGKDVTSLSDLGTIKRHETNTVSLAKNTSKTIATVTLPEGLWLILGTVRYSSNADGRRYTEIQDSSTGAPQHYFGIDSIPAAEGNPTYGHVRDIVSLSESKTFNLVGWQNSGITLQADGRLYAIKLK